MKTLKITKIILFVSLALLLISVSFVLVVGWPVMFKNVAYSYYYPTEDIVIETEIKSVIFYSDGRLVETLPNGETRTKKYYIHEREIFIEGEDDAYGFINTGYWIWLNKYKVTSVDTNGYRIQSSEMVMCYPLKDATITMIIAIPVIFIIFITALIVLIIKSRKIKKATKVTNN